MDRNYISNVEMLNKLWHRLIKLTQYKQLEQKYKRLTELSTIEIEIISIVSKRPDIIFREICEMFNIPKSSLTNIIDRIEGRGYLKRTISSRDRRSYGLELTDEGVEAQKEHLSYEHEIMGGIINALDTEEEKYQFITLIEKIVANLEK